MPLFDYRARTPQGDLLEGVLDSADSNGVASYLFNIGATPVQIKLAARQAITSESPWWDKLLESQPTSLDVQLFSRQMYTLLRAGVPLLRALAGLQESAIHKGFSRVLKEVRASLDAGRELSAAMRAHPKVFSPFYVSMVQVGEMTGKMGEIFPRLHDYLETERATKGQIEAALRYPKFVVLAMIAAIGVVNMFVIPSFNKIFAKTKTELPFMTKVLLTSSEFTVQNWPILLAAVVLTIVGVRTFIATPDGRYRWDKLKLRMPIVGDLVLKGTMSRFARSFALAQRSGIPVGQTLSIVARTVDNAYVASRVEQIRDGVERGESIYRTASTTGVFTPVALQMIAVGEESGEMDKLMDEIAEMYEREVQYEIKTLSTRMEPIMLILMGGMVLVLALGVFLPMWGLGRAMGMKGMKTSLEDLIGGLYYG
jgi:MSHA biogenesis protein MshG